MKKLSIFALALVMMISLAACGGGNTNETSTPTTTSPAIIPSTNPTIETNIPDPNVDTTMPIYTDGTESTENSGMTGGGNGTTGGSNGTTGGGSGMTGGAGMGN